MKISAVPDKKAYPYRDPQPIVKRLTEAYGVDRLMYGGGFAAGSITVELPSSVSARVEAKTVNGGIESDFPLTVTGRFGPRRVSGTIGGGGRDLRLETVNGGIHIRQGR